MSDFVDYPAMFGQETWAEARYAAYNEHQERHTMDSTLCTFLDSLLAAGALHIEHRTGDDGAGAQWTDKDGKQQSSYRAPSRYQRLVSRWQHT